MVDAKSPVGVPGGTKYARKNNLLSSSRIATKPAIRGAKGMAWCRQRREAKFSSLSKLRNETAFMVGERYGGGPKRAPESRSRGSESRFAKATKLQEDFSGCD